MAAANQTLVVALGGNAIVGPGEVGTIDQQFAHAAQTAAVLCDAVQLGYQLVVTHGNGPQVGNVLRRAEIASDQLYPLPLEVCVADTQAGMGYMIAQCLLNTLRQRGLDRDVTAIVTTVLVDRDDPAFSQPSKPIGPFLSATQAEAHRAGDGWSVQQVGGNRFRRIVPSPMPRAILELAAIRTLVAAGHLVVACGGGGIPVVQDETGRYRGAAAVIDKDHTSGLLARELGVETLVILTTVDRVYLDFDAPARRGLAQLTVAEAQAHLAAGQFAAGSMQPKIETAIDFVTRSRHDSAAVIIAGPERLTEALAGTSGTRVVR